VETSSTTHSTTSPQHVCEKYHSKTLNNKRPRSEANVPSVCRPQTRMDIESHVQRVFSSIYIYILIFLNNSIYISGRSFPIKDDPALWVFKLFKKAGR
jgi:hypothetical protein